MEPDFWHERWATNQIGFHDSQVSPLLIAHFAALDVPRGGRVFVPLCGKSLDIDWLLSRGHRVAGAELSAIAVAQVFERLDITPTITRAGDLELRSGGGVDLFVGDFFRLPREALGAVDAVYDRAALIALPPDMRRQYAAHLLRVASSAPQLLITLEYDQSCIDGPPFSVTGAEIRGLYGGEPALLARGDVSGGLKGKCPATENAWLLNARQ